MKIQQLFRAYLKTVVELPRSDIYGLSRSCLIYYAQPWKWQKLRDFYQPFMKEGDLCFDIGAHVGNRTYFWRELKARVVAVEPHRSSSLFLKAVFQFDSNVTVSECAIGSRPAHGQLFIDPRNPTINTLSKDWQQQVKKDKSWQKASWHKQQSVQISTLDQLIEEHGCPRFCKLDIEGSELAALEGLSQAIPTLSFEYIPHCLDQALACMDRLDKLSTYRYNWSQGESLSLAFEPWLSREEMGQFLKDHSVRSHVSGDVIATCESAH